MKFYCINKQDALGHARQMLANACKELGVEFVELVSEQCNVLELPVLGKNDLLYRVSTNKASVALEQFLLNENVTTFYRNALTGKNPRSYLTLKNSDVAHPKTVSVPTLNKEFLEKYVAYLGGFPLVVKVVSGTQGVGVIKVESMPSLYSILDYLEANGSKYILREFINSSSSARLVVLGEEVIASIEYKSASKDFRSNSRMSSVKVCPKEYSKEIQAAAIEATKLAGLEFAGVDVMLDEKGNHYVLEVNFPFGFPEAQTETGVDIAKKMVSFLMEKSKK